mgnify:CR=1 FL=1
MFDQIISGLKSQVGGEIQEKTGISDSMLGSVMDVVKTETTKTVGSKLMGGNLDTVMNLFSNDSNSKSADGLQASLTTGIMDGLMDKLGLDSSKAGSIVKIIIPSLLSLITKKNEETPKDDASPLTSLFGGGDGISGMAGKALKGLF